MCSLPKYTCTSIPSISTGQNLLTHPALNSQRRNGEIPIRNVPSFSPVQYPGSPSQEILVMSLNN